MTPTEYYQRELESGKLQPDPAQAQAVAASQRLYDELLAAAVRPGGWRRWFVRPSAAKGLYFCGQPGRGKTVLMDYFYACLPFAEKTRVHFHLFMRNIHQQLRTLPKSPDPLVIVAKKIAADIRVLCLDEFHVHDIADAMLLAGLLKALFDHGVTLVTTSNIVINDLYKNGLQRDRFLYAIALLQEHTQQIVLDGEQDYRLALLEKNQAYHVLPRTQARFQLELKFNALAPCPPKHNRQISINGRKINYLALADDVIWFDFDALCNTPRSAYDYLEIAQMFHAVLISHVYVMGEAQDSIAKRFIHLIDALYDHNVKLILTAEKPMNELYSGRRQRNAIQRTLSRLHEMGGRSYLAKPHLLRGA
ncbi:ATPase, AFG1 family [hydrothermal vent metagenome]|uniref:ATPase, AFG1 family n=1 Tax=hydrothermal vent metagenome TaxID=652676 RepID=A0A3B1BQ91_9ZZZZ